MRTIRLTKFGFDGLSTVDLPTPKPGPGQVLVRIRAVSLNYRDLMVVKGIYNPKMRLPIVPLSDGAGEVVEIGEGVDRVAAGNRVAGTFFQRWASGILTEEAGKSALGGAIDGVLSEFVLFDQNGLVQIPAHLTYEEAATLPCAAVTAWHALVHSERVKSGDSVLLQGTGGVSIFALQFARMSGARVIITSSSDAKLSLARDLGAHETVNYKAHPDWEEKVRGLTGGVGVDHVVEVGGAGTLGKSLRAVRIGGHIALIGVLSGGGEVNPMPILMKHVRLQGIYVGSREMFEAMNKAISLHRLKPVIDRVFSFDEFPAALKHMESGSHFGKIVVKV